MTIQHEHFPGVCTAHYVFNFGHTRESYARYFTPGAAGYEGAQSIDELKALWTKNLATACNNARQSRKAIVQAYTTEAQELGNEVLAEFGFVRAMVARDVKYPDSSRNLILWAYNLNPEKGAVEVTVDKAANPFQRATTPAVAPPAAPVMPVAAAPEPMLTQSGNPIPDVGERFYIDRSQPIPATWAPLQIRAVATAMDRDYRQILANQRWWTTHGRHRPARILVERLR